MEDSPPSPAVPPNPSRGSRLAIVVALVAAGFATSLLLMIFIYPLLGHATWYLYRELVGD